MVEAIITFAVIVFLGVATLLLLFGLGWRAEFGTFRRERPNYGVITKVLSEAARILHERKKKRRISSA